VLKFLKIASLILLAIIIGIATFFGILYLGGFGHIPSKKELQSIEHETASLVFSENNELIGKFYAQNRTEIKFEDFPKSLIDALIATEDARFYEHDGLDQKSMVRVMFKTILMGIKSAGGGSTITQQLAKNLYGRKSYGQISIVVNKLKEIILARRIEKVYEKSAILELYLNTIPFGENVYGIEAAAKRYFNKKTSQLKVEESAVLVGLLKANSYYNPRLYPEHASDRRNVVLHQMTKYNYLSDAAYDSLKLLPLKLSYLNLSKSNDAPYFLKKVKSEASHILKELEGKGKQYDIEKDGLKIYTSLDIALQKKAKESIENNLAKAQDLLRKQYQRSPYAQNLQKLVDKLAKQNDLDLKNSTQKERFLFNWNDSSDYQMANLNDSLKHVLSQLHAGIIGINPQSGAIKAWVGGINFRHYPFDQIVARRQMASTIKPFLYATAISSGSELCDYLSNDPITLQDYENWSPQNYDGEIGGKYSLAAALARSKNIPTLHLFFKVSSDSLKYYWDQLGFIEPLHDEPSAIYGTNSVSLLELAVAYSAFANNGYTVNPYCIQRIETQDGEVIFEHESSKSIRVFEEVVSLKINAALHKAAKNGTGQALYNRYGVTTKWASKTGTSQNFADAWYVAYNHEIVLASRVGASYPNIHFANGSQGSGSALALPLIADCIASSKSEKWYYAGLKNLPEIDCEDFIAERDLDKFLKLFQKDSKTLKEAKDKAAKKEKRKGFFKKLLGK
tara:strand:+ start:3956 stop:6160 length:2205 start_codon:yes stop_codon:yes gene_type:complete